MPTVLRLDGLRVVVYPNDHRPENVHVIGGGCEAVFNLHCPRGPVELRENFRFAPQKVTRIAADLESHLTALCQEWERIHGPV
jgi:hypothetical protein